MELRLCQVCHLKTQAHQFASRGTNIIVNGGGARKRASFDSNPPELEEITPELTIKVTNDAGNVIDILDKETGHSIATRQLDNAGAAGALGFLFKIDGRAVSGDIFNFSANSGGLR